MSQAGDIGQRSFESGYAKGKIDWSHHNDERSCLIGTLRDFLYCFEPGSGPVGYVPPPFVIGYETAVLERCAAKHWETKETFLARAKLKELKDAAAGNHRG